MIDLSRLDGHEKIALSFSGGKDSLACVYLLREHLDRITIYHNDTGDLLPEVMEIVAHVKSMAPHFVHIRGNVKAWWQEHGIPSDLVPYTAAPFAGVVGHSSRLISRYDCCFANLMLPVWERIRDDGNTLCIRGTKKGDFPRLPKLDAESGEGVEFYYPLQDMTHEEVFAYLRSEGAPICRVYEAGLQSPECATCPAWLSVGQGEYLRKYHPALLAEYRENMNVVMGELSPILANLASEVRSLTDG